MLRITALALAVTAGAATTAAGAGRPAVPGPVPAPGVAIIKKTSLLCSADSANFRVWWGDTPGAGVSLQGADRRCQTLPPAANEALLVAELVRSRLAAQGYPRLLGDAPPRYRRQAAIALRLLRAKPDARARILGSLARSRRGPLLAGLTASERRRVLAGLPPRLRSALRREIAAALRGGAAVFVGGNRKLDIVLHAARNVLTRVDGSTACRNYAFPRTKATFRATAVLVFSPGVRANRATLAHELAHSMHCRMGLPPTTAPLLREGSAEALAAMTDPVGYPGPAQTVAGDVVLFGGAERTARFCSTFNPLSTKEQDPYRSWATWMALDIAHPGLLRSTLVNAVRTPRRTATEVLTDVGDARWSPALALATREACGALRSPSGQTTFPSAMRSLIAGSGTGTLATPAVPATVTVPAGGVRTVDANWGPPTPSGVTLRLSGAGISPATLAAGTVVVSGGAQVATAVDGAALVASLPPAAIATGKATVTVANPTSTQATAFDVQVVVTP